MISVKRHKNRHLANLVMGCVIALGCAGAWAGEASNKQEAIAIAKSQHHGKVLKVEPRHDVYVVRMLSPDGRITQLSIPRQNADRSKQRNPR